MLQLVCSWRGSRRRHRLRLRQLKMGAHEARHASARGGLWVRAGEIIAYIETIAVAICRQLEVCYSP